MKIKSIRIDVIKGGILYFGELDLSKLVDNQIDIGMKSYCTDLLSINGDYTLPNGFYFIDCITGVDYE